VGTGFNEFYCTYTAVQLKSRLQHNATWMATAWPPHCLCYHSALYFCHLHLMTLSFLHWKIWCVFQFFAFYFPYNCVSLKLHYSKMCYVRECLNGLPGCNSLYTGNWPLDYTVISTQHLWGEMVSGMVTEPSISWMQSGSVSHSTTILIAWVLSTSCICEPNNLQRFVPWS